MACFISETFINDPQLLPIITKNGEVEDLYTLWGILNSKIATFYHFNHSPKATKGAFPKILVQDIKDFPLPEVTQKQKSLLASLVQEAMEKHQQVEYSQTIESEIDLLVYHLYGLTYDEVLIVDPETPIAREEYNNVL